jgi:Ca2+-dependent lipid-binding protein
MESTLKVRVYDKDTLSDDILGEYDVNLNLLTLLEFSVTV